MLYSSKQLLLPRGSAKFESAPASHKSREQPRTQKGRGGNRQKTKKPATEGLSQYVAFKLYEILLHLQSQHGPCCHSGMNWMPAYCCYDTMRDYIYCISIASAPSFFDLAARCSSSLPAPLIASRPFDVRYKKWRSL